MTKNDFKDRNVSDKHLIVITLLVSLLILNIKDVTALMISSRIRPVGKSQRDILVNGIRILH